jgi:O-antigen ligase
MIKLSTLPQTRSMAGTYRTDAGENAHLGLGWALPGFLLLGLAATLVILGLSSTFSGLATWKVALLIPIAPAALSVGFFAAPQGLQNLRSLFRKLVWWHWLWMLILLSTWVFRIRDSQLAASEPIDAWAMFRLLPEAMVTFWLLSRLLNRRTSWLGSLLQGLVGTLGVYALVCVTSALWSVKPSWTLYKSCEYLLDVAVLAAALSVIRSVETYESLFNWVWTLCAIELLLTWMGAVLWPSQAWEQFPTRLIGVFPVQSSNAIGVSGAILAVIALSRLLPVAGCRFPRSWNALVLFFGIASMLASKTRNAMAGFVIGALLVLVASHRARIAAFLTVVPAACLYLASRLLDVRVFPAFTGMVVDYLAREQNADQLESLTGRMQWWEFAWQQFTKHPWTGLGAYAGGKFAVLSKLGFGDTAHLHSDYLEAIVGTSIWGLIPLLIAIFGTWWFLFRFLRSSALKPFERQLLVEAIGVFGILTVRSFFNAEFVWHAPQYFLVILGYAELLRRRAKWGQSALPTSYVKSRARIPATAFGSRL